MAARVFPKAKSEFLKGNLDLTADDIRVLLVASNSAYDPGNTSEDPATLSAMNGGAGIAGVEFDGSGYSRKALASETVTEDGTNEKATFDATDVTWTSLAAGTYAIEGALVYKQVTSDSDHIPLAWCPYSADQTPNGSDFTTTWPSGGILTLS